MSRRTLAARFINGSVSAPASLGAAQLMPTTIKTGRAASVRKGVSHLVREAAIATDSTGATLVALWECGGRSVNATPVAKDNNHATCANCAEAVRFPRGPVVYRCYADDGDLIYIGSSIDLYTRIRAHRAPSGSRWWDEVSRVDAEPHPTEAAARLAEARAITDELPFYNRDGIPPAAATP